MQSIQDIIGRHSNKEYIEYVEKGLIPNCPITKGNIFRAEDTLDPKSQIPERQDYKKKAIDELPEGMLEEHGNVTLAVDIMHINKMPFIITISRAICFGTIEMTKDERRVTIMKSLQQVINTYNFRGFRV